MHSSYKFYEDKFNNTKPIRGRSVEVKPIGQRRRDWETITTKEENEGKVYCAKLYSTECVEYFPNGDVLIRAGQWATPTTAEFIHEHSPFSCFKRYNKLWIQNRDELLPINGELRLQYLGDAQGFKPYKEVVIQQRVVDKQLAKAARAPLMPFLKFGEAFLKMSDGWIMHETRMQAGIGIGNYGRYTFERLYSGEGSGANYAFLYNHIATCDESEYLYALCYLLQDNEYQQSRTAEIRMVEIGAGSPNSWIRKCEFSDYKYSQTLLRTRVFNIAKQAKNIYKTVEVKPSGKAVTNTL